MQDDLAVPDLGAGAFFGFGIGAQYGTRYLTSIWIGQRSEGGR